MAETYQQAVQRQGVIAAQRVEWLRSALGRAQATSERALQSVNDLTTQLQAAELAVSMLRDEYRKLVKDEEPQGE